MSKRLSLTLDHEDELAVLPFVHEGPERDALAACFAQAALTTDAAVLRALIRVGAQAIREHTMDQAYADWAASTTTDERDEQREIRARQRQARAKRDQGND